MTSPHVIEDSFEFVLFDVEPLASPLISSAPLHQHKKRSCFQSDFPSFSEYPNLDLHFNNTSGSSSSSVSSTLISRVNSNEVERSNIKSQEMTPSTSGESIRGTPVSLGGSKSNGKSSRATSSSPIGINTTLVADLKMSKNRVVITKKYTIYELPAVPYKSAIVGFNVTFHNPPSARSRVRDAEFNLVFYGPSADSPSPIIKAISPGQGTSSIGVSTATEHTRSNSAIASLGYNPYGTLQLTRGHSSSFTIFTAAKLVTSGIDTTHCMITLEEDTHTHAGIPSSFDFAVLVALPPFPSSPDSSPPPDSVDKLHAHLSSSPLESEALVEGFEIDLSVEASIGVLGMREGVRRMMGSPRSWRLGYDGKSEIGQIEMGDLNSDATMG